MGDSNSRAELPRPDGFQDRSLQPDLGNPPCLSNNSIKFIKSDSVCQQLFSKFFVAKQKDCLHFSSLFLNSIYLDSLIRDGKYRQPSG